MSKILVIKNAKLEGPGTIGQLIQSDGFSVDTIFAKKEKIPPLNHNAVIILGAPESANDELAYLKEEQNLIRQAVEKNIPVLGICLGSQLIAKAFGARVYPGPKKEIGFYSDVILDETPNSLFYGMPNPLTVFHWHGDTFEVPINGIRLAHSNLYNQAFQYGSAVGVQFHLEVNKEIILSWLENTDEDIKLPYIDPAKIKQDIDSNIDIVQKNMEIFYRNFKSRFKL